MNGETFQHIGLTLSSLCRILYSHAHGTVVSKPGAAEWALRVLPETWHEVIKQALAGNVDQMSTGIDMPSIARFIECADTQLRANPEPGRGPF